VEFDPLSADFFDDPYDTYRWLRDEAPVYHNDRYGFWALSRHADVHAAFRDTVRFSNLNGVSLDPAASNPAATATMSFLAMDPPRHTRMRAIVSRERRKNDRRWGKPDSRVFRNVNAVPLAAAADAPWATSGLDFVGEPSPDRVDLALNFDSGWGPDPEQVGWAVSASGSDGLIAYQGAAVDRSLAMGAVILLGTGLVCIGVGRARS